MTDRVEKMLSEKRFYETNRKDINALYNFWVKINNMSQADYLRVQRLCSRYLGGWVRGFSSWGVGRSYLIIE